MPATNPLTLLVKIYNCLEQTTSKLSFDIQQFSSTKVKQVDITASLATTTILNRDVKTVYFSEPVTGLPKPVFYRLPKGLLCERDNCHRSLRACYQSIACCFKAVVARIPDARTPTPQNKGQWRI